MFPEILFSHSTVCTTVHPVLFLFFIQRLCVRFICHNLFYLYQIAMNSSGPKNNFDIIYINARHACNSSILK